MSQSVELVKLAELPDAFADEFARLAEREAREQCARFRNEPH